MAMTSVSYAAIANRYRQSPQDRNNVCLRYIWLDGNGYDLRTKTRQTNVVPKSLEEVPLWTYCGQTCGHMKLTADSDCWLKPVLLCNDPFRAHEHKLVLCVPIRYEIQASIYRHSCESTLNKLIETNKPSLTMSQPYILIDSSTRRPIGWPSNQYIPPKSSYTRSIDANKIYGRDINEAFYKACVYAGISIIGTQAGHSPSVWSFEISASDGLNIADQLWMARYILHYIGEEFNCVVSFKPKPLPDIDLGQDLKVFLDNNQITRTDLSESELGSINLNNNKDKNLTEKLSGNIRNGNESLQEMSFASDIDPYVAVESIIRNKIV